MNQKAIIFTSDNPDLLIDSEMYFIKYRENKALRSGLSIKKMVRLGMPVTWEHEIKLD